MLNRLASFLEEQEKFVEIQEEKKREAIRLEVEKRIEDERIAKEKADKEAAEKAKKENPLHLGRRVPAQTARSPSWAQEHHYGAPPRTASPGPFPH
jgi:hypothetical protein